MFFLVRLIKVQIVAIVDTMRQNSATENHEPDVPLSLLRFPKVRKKHSSLRALFFACHRTGSLSPKEGNFGMFKVYIHWQFLSVRRTLVT